VIPVIENVTHTVLTEIMITPIKDSTLPILETLPALGVTLPALNVRISMVVDTAGLALTGPTCWPAIPYVSAHFPQIVPTAILTTTA